MSQVSIKSAWLSRNGIQSLNEWINECEFMVHKISIVCVIPSKSKYTGVYTH